MSTVNKNFKVKNGLDVALGATFGDAITIGEPTSSDHAATKSYVDMLAGSVYSGSTAPESPTTGKMWFDTEIDRLKIYGDTDWVVIPNYQDTLVLPQHIHDTSIDGTGLIIAVFTDGGDDANSQVLYLDAGAPDTESWSNILDGGTL